MGGGGVTLKIKHLALSIYHWRRKGRALVGAGIEQEGEEVFELRGRKAGVGVSRLEVGAPKQGKGKLNIKHLALSIYH